MIPRRPRAAAAMMGAMGAISSSTTFGGAPRPMFIQDTNMAWRVWLKDGLTSRNPGTRPWVPAITYIASRPVEARVRAFEGGIHGI